MQIVNKNKINFITEILWIRHNEEHKVNLKQMKKQGNFNHMCKTDKLLPSYGFVRLELTKKTINKDTKKKVKKKVTAIKNPVSLGLFVTHALGIDKQIDDLFICFRVNESQIGYVLIYKGSIFPNDGEYIGDADAVMSKIIMLSREYNIHNIRVCDDVPFYNNKEFFKQSRLENIIIMPSTKEKDKLISASDYHLWEHKGLKKTLSKAIIRPLVALQKEHRILLSAFGVIALVGMLYYVKDAYFPDVSNVQAAAQEYVYINTSGIDAQVFLEKCFSQIDSYLKPMNKWQANGLSCNLSGMSINYVPDDGGQADDIKKVIVDSGLSVKDDGTSATLQKRFDLTKIHPYSSSLSLKDQLDKLKADAEENRLDVLMKGSRTVEISSTVSPIFLYNHNVINNLNILEISMSLDDSGLYNWKIKGDLNGK